MSIILCKNSLLSLLLLLLLFTAVTAAASAEAEAQSSSSSSSSSKIIISRFQEYLQINTAQPNPNYYEAADFIISQANSLSLHHQTLEFVPGKPLLLLKWPGSNPHLPSVLLNSHTDVVPVEHHKWTHPPFDARLDSNGDIYARGSQDMKCVGMQYLEAIRRLKSSGFHPLRTFYLPFVPDEEIGGHDGAEIFADPDVFKKMNVGIVLDEGLASPNENYRVFYAERCPMWLVIKATGAPGHGANLYDNTDMENLLKTIESIMVFHLFFLHFGKNRVLLPSGEVGLASFLDMVFKAAEGKERPDREEIVKTRERKWTIWWCKKMVFLSV